MSRRDYSKSIVLVGVIDHKLIRSSEVTNHDAGEVFLGDNTNDVARVI
jgi:hypothetical protein